MAEFYIIVLVGCIGIGAYAYHMVKMQGQIDYLNESMERQARKFEEDE
tara:strand:+ start:1033 stop:1176 length:144 start_codon:yes stop_codon:yes gene_type:complete